MKNKLIFLLCTLLIACPLLFSSQGEEYISYKVNGLKFHLTEVILEYYPDAYYLHIEGTKSFKADLGPDHFPRHKDCESGITIEFSQEGDSFLGRMSQTHRIPCLYTYHGACCVRRKTVGKSWKILRPALTAKTSRCCSLSHLRNSVRPVRS